MSEADVDEVPEESRPEAAGNQGRAKTRSFPFLTIESAARILLGKIRKSRELISIAEEKHESLKANRLRPYARRLEPQERIAIEAQITRLVDSRNDRVNEKLDDSRRRRGLPPIDRETEKNFYPVASEQAVTVMSDYFNEAEREIWAEIQDMYAGKEIYLAFATNYYVALTQPTLMEHLATSLLSTSIYSVEDFIAALVRCTLTLGDAEALGEMPPVPYKVVESYGSDSQTYDIKRWAIDRRTEEFVRDGPREWRDNIQRWCGIDLDDIGGDWATMREAVARARLYARGTGGRVDAQYLSEVDREKSRGLALWDELETDDKYLLFLLDQMEVALLCLSLRWAQHFFPDPEVNVDYFIDRGVGFEREGKWNHADILWGTLLDTFVHRDHPSFNLARLNEWFCKQQLGKEDDADRRAIDNFEPESNWQAIGKSALQREWATLTRVLVDYLKERPNDRAWVRSMPIIHRSVNEHPSLNTLFTDSRSERGRRSNRGRGKSR